MRTKDQGVRVLAPGFQQHARETVGKDLKGAKGAG